MNPHDSTFRADLHCHTTSSDGTLSPEEVVLLAAEKKLQGLSFTDHDSIGAYDSGIKKAEALGIEIISGVEFSTIHQKGVSIHVLGYGFSLNSPIIQTFCFEHQKRRENRMKEMLHLLKKHHMPIQEEEVYAQSGVKCSIGRPHIAKAMVAKSYVKNVNEAFRRFLGDGKSCYASGNPYTTEETLDLIRAANGYSFLAHPHLINNSSILKSLLEMKFDGIEAYYARFRDIECKRFVDLAEKKGWLISGGSDFHGDTKPNIELGSSWTNESIFRLLQKRFRENQAL